MLKPIEYHEVQTLIHSYSCLDVSERIVAPRTLRVSEFSSGAGEKSCRMPTEGRCEFLAKLSVSAGIRGVVQNEKSIRDIAVDIECGVDDTTKNAD